MRRNYLKLLSISVAISLIFTQVGVNVDALETANNQSYTTRKVPVKRQAEIKKKLLEHSAARQEKFSYKSENEVVNCIAEVTKAYRGKLKEAIRLVKDKVAINVSVKFNELVYGFSFKTKRGNLAKIEKIKCIKSVSEQNMYKAAALNWDSFTSVVNSGEHLFKEYDAKGEGMAVAVIDCSFDTNHKDFKEIDSSKVKFTKKEMEDKIESIGYGEYINDKIPFAYNYAGNNNKVFLNNGHGTHVAGIIGANGDKEKLEGFKAVRGVAPQTQIFMMKVGEDTKEYWGSAFDENMIRAIEDCVKLKVDVINMSMGETFGYEDNTLMNKAIKKAMDAGILFVTAAGNESTSTCADEFSFNYNSYGLNDIATIAKPAVYKSAFAVGSVSASKIVTRDPEIVFEAEGDKLVIDNAERDNHFMSYDLKNCEFEVVGKEFLELDSDDLSKVEKERYDNKYLIAKDIDVSDIGKLYRMRLSFELNGVVFIWEDDNLAPADGRSEDDIPFIYIKKSDGDRLIEFVKNHKKCDMKESGEYSVYSSETSGLMSPFSSWGPSPLLELKPDICGIGGNVYSTLPNDGYGMASGTSMASPYVAGAQALVLQRIRNENLKDANLTEQQILKALAMNTATQVLTKDGEICSPRQQGAGLINIDRALESDVLITDVDSYPSLSLRDIESTVKFKIRLVNLSNQERKYQLQADGITFSQPNATLAAKETKEIECELKVKEGQKLQSFVEGYIKAKSLDAHTDLTIPYMGFYGVFEKDAIIDAPVYDEDSIVKKTGLVSEYMLGYDVSNDKVVKENMYYSTAIEYEDELFGDEAPKPLVPVLGMLKFAKSIRSELVDSKGKLVKLLGSTGITRKVSNVENGFAYRNQDLAWDGTKYNIKTGEYEPVLSGSYAIRITAESFSGKEQQVITMPFKIDSDNPVASIIGVTKTEDGKHQLSWNAVDNLSDMASYVDIYSNDDVVTVKEKDLKIDLTTDTYSVVLEDVGIKYKDDNYNEIAITVFDKAFNSDVQYLGVDQQGFGDDDICILDIEDGAKINSENGVEISLIKGRNVTEVRINGEKIDTLEEEDGIVYAYADIDETTDKLHFEGFVGDKKVFDKIYNVSVDTQAPEIEYSFDEPMKYLNTVGLIGNNIYINPTGEKLSLNLKVNDRNLTDRIYYYINDGKKRSSKLDENNSTKLQFDNKNGDINSIEIVAEDEFENRALLNFNILKDDGEINVSDSISVGRILNSSDLKGKNKTLFSTHVSNHDYVIVRFNGELVEHKRDEGELVYEKYIPINQGKNVVHVNIQDKNGKELADYHVTFYCDSIAPEIEIESLKEKKKSNSLDDLWDSLFEELFRMASKKIKYENVYIKKPVFNIKGNVSDNINDILLRINGEIVKEYDQTEWFEGPVKKAFEHKIKLKKGKNIISMSCNDLVNNVKEAELKVYYLPKADSKITFDAKYPKGKYKNHAVAKIKVDTPHVNNIFYSLDGKKFKMYKKRGFTLKKTTKIFVKYVDKAGNKSKVSSRYIIVGSKKATELKKVNVGKITTSTSKIKGKYYKNGATIAVYNGNKLLGKYKVKKNKYSIKIKKQKKNTKLTIVATKKGMRMSSRVVKVK